MSTAKGRGIGAHALRACYLGLDGGLRRQVEQLLTSAGYACLPPEFAGNFDVLIDAASQNAEQARAAWLAAGRVGQYVLISSHRVYPATPRLRPWQVEDIDVLSDQPTWGDRAMLDARLREREVLLLSRRESTPLTILRCAPLEGEDTGERTPWFVERVLNGERVVFPSGPLPDYRVTFVADLAHAIRSVVGQNMAYDKTYNVASRTLLSYWGHAALVRDGLNRPLRFGYVPAWRWQAAGLVLPGESDAQSAFMSISPGLRTLGWQPVDPISAMLDLARKCAQTGRRRGSELVAVEHRLLVEAEAEQGNLYQPGLSAQPLPMHATRQWKLSAWSGHPASLSLVRMEQPNAMPTPLVKVKALTLLSAEERLLRGEYPQHGQRALGHNALLEVMASGRDDLAVGQTVLPVSVMPCAEPDCRFCAGGHHGVLGIGSDGYGLGICTTPASHLLPVPKELGHAALLADSLACLMSGLMGERLTADAGPVWIAGRTVEAALVAWLAQDAGRAVVMVDRRAWKHEEFPAEAITPMRERRNKGEVPAPTLAFDFTGNADVAWDVSHALAAGGHFFVRRRPPGIAHGIHWHHLPAAAPSRAALVGALAKLQNWAGFRLLERRLGPAIPLDLYWDALLPSPFSLPYLEDRP